MLTYKLKVKGELLIGVKQGGYFCDGEEGLYSCCSMSLAQPFKTFAIVFSRSEESI